MEATQIIELVIDENDEKTGIHAVSVVKSPAIEENFIALSKHEVELKEEDGYVYLQAQQVDLEQKIEKQNEDVTVFLAGRETNYDPSSLLIAQQKATRTSVELLREEVDELHQIIRLILK